MLNKVTLIGRLGKNPELRYTQSGVPVASFSIATSESFTDREGNRQEKTEWHNITFFQKQAEICAQYLQKGSLVYIEGSLHTRSWDDQQGQKRYSTEIRGSRFQFLEKRSTSYDEYQMDDHSQVAPAFPQDSSMDEVPF